MEAEIGAVVNDVTADRIKVEGDYCQQCPSNQDRKYLMDSGKLRAKDGLKCPNRENDQPITEVATRNAIVNKMEVCNYNPWKWKIINDLKRKAVSASEIKKGSQRAQKKVGKKVAKIVLSAKVSAKKKKMI